MEQKSNSIAEQKGLGNSGTHESSNGTCHRCSRDLTGAVEVDEPCPGGAWRNKWKMIQDAGTRRSRGTSKQPVFWYSLSEQQEWAEIVTSVDENTLLSLISRKDDRGSTVCSDVWKT
jgi:hypothetical protein